MATPFLGEIRLAGFNFAPVGWAFCDGTLLPIAEYSALFTLIGTTYGGDGQTTFALPDLRSRVPIHMGNGFVQGENGGSESVALNGQQVPSHVHSSAQCLSTAGSSSTPPANGIWAASSMGSLYATLPPSVTMGGSAGPAFASTGGGQSHENRQPSLAINYIIALEGVYPSQG
jgi:microcystin-dependent protein